MIHNSSIIDKKAKVGNNVKISHLSYIGDSVIDKNSNIGAGTIIGLARGVNAKWTDGGLIYSPPFR